MSYKRNIYIFISASIFLCGISSCDKFPLLKNEQEKHVPSGENLLNKTIWEYLSEDNFHEGRTSGIGLYGKAIQHARLNDLLNTQDANFTVIIPRDEALLSFINQLGYQKITDMPPIVLRNLLLNTIIDTRIRSFDLGIDENRALVSLSEDSLYMQRTASSADEYILRINVSNTSNSPSTNVRSQNLDFKNGVAHIVNSVTHYITSTSLPDPADGSSTDYLTDTVYVSKDTYLRNGAGKAINYGGEVMLTSKLANETGVNIFYARKILLQMPIKTPAYADNRIGSAKLEVYVNQIEVSTRDSYMNFYECSNDNFNEMTVAWENAPLFGTAPMAASDFKGRMNSWQKIDISPYYISYLEQGKQFINIGAYTTADNALSVRSKEFDNGKFKARIIMYSPAQSILTLANNHPIGVSKHKKIRVLTLEDLMFTGTDDKNISYTLTTLPERGFIVINGLPTTINSSFTQEQLRKGAVRYLLGDDATDIDNFNVEIRDYQGGIYATPINLQVVVQDN